LGNSKNSYLSHICFRFFFGHVPQIAAKLKQGKGYVEIILEWQAECGLFLIIWKFNEPEIMQSHPDGVKFIAMEKFPKERMDALITSWHKQM
jgi:hypothetical protein